MAKKKKKKIIQFPQTLEAQIRTRARNLKIGKCYISEDWEIMRECNILISREHINGNLTFGIFLTDLAMFGVKDVIYNFNMSKIEFSDFFDELQSNDYMEEIDYNFAHNIIYGSVEYAGEYGFKPAKNYLTGKYILEEDNDDIPFFDIEFGEGGLPTIFCSDKEPFIKEINQLAKIAGEGNYQVINTDRLNIENSEIKKEYEDWNSDQMEDPEEENELWENELFAEMEKENEAMLNELKEGKEWKNTEYPVNNFSETLTVKTSEIWKTLYSLCYCFYSLNPWKYLFETDLFAVEIPESRKKYFISIMGSEGDVFAMSAYEGITALQQFRDIYEQTEYISPQTILTIPHMIISLDDINIIRQDQKKIIKKTGVDLKGKQFFINITRIIPGLVPSTPDEEHLFDLYYIITQCLNVITRAKIDENLIYPKNINKNKYLFRVPVKKENFWVWNDEYRLIKPTPVICRSIYLPEKLKTFSSLDIGAIVAQVDIVLLPAPIREKDKPEYFPFMLILFNPDTDIITGFETLAPFPDYENMISKIPAIIMNKYIEEGSRPMKFEYNNHKLHGIMQFFKEKTPIQVTLTTELDALESAIDSMLDSIL